MSDGVGMQSCKGLLHLPILFANDLAGSDGVDEQFTDDGEVGSAAITGDAVIAFVCDILILGRGTGSGNQLSWYFRILHKPSQAERGSTFHQRIDKGLQVLLVLGEQIVLPQRVHQPRTSQVPVGPHRILAFLAHRIGHRPDVGVMA